MRGFPSSSRPAWGSTRFSLTALPSFVTLVLIPLTFSITQGILCGFVLQALLYGCFGRAREVPMTLWLLALRSLGLLLIR
jgi:AGZA family xanthine/uracil permease-like MFS transporter